MLTRDEVTTTLKQKLHERFAPEFPNNPEALTQKLWDVMWTFCSEDPPDCPEVPHDKPWEVAYTNLATAFIEYFKHDNENEELLAESCWNLLFLANAVLIEVFDKRMPPIDPEWCLRPTDSDPQLVGVHGPQAHGRDRSPHPDG